MTVEAGAGEAIPLVAAFGLLHQWAEPGSVAVVHKCATGGQLIGVRAFEQLGEIVARVRQDRAIKPVRAALGLQARPRTPMRELRAHSGVVQEPDVRYRLMRALAIVVRRVEGADQLRCWMAVFHSFRMKAGGDSHLRQPW